MVTFVSAACYDKSATSNLEGTFRWTCHLYPYSLTRFGSNRGTGFQTHSHGWRDWTPDHWITWRSIYHSATVLWRQRIKQLNRKPVKTTPMVGARSGLGVTGRVIHFLPFTKKLIYSELVFLRSRDHFSETKWTHDRTVSAILRQRGLEHCIWDQIHSILDERPLHVYHCRCW